MKRLTAAAALVLLLGGLSFPLRASPGVEDASLPPMVRIPPTAVPPVIDGRISPGEWDRAFMGTGIVRHGTGEGLDPVKAQYWFAYDDRNVYVAARMQTRPGENFATLPRRLGGGGPSANFEILIDPNPCNPDHNWVQGMFYPLGKYENVGYSQRIGGYVPYDVEWTYRDSAADGWWTIEFTAPAEALNRAAIRDGGSWGVLFAGAIRSAMYYFSGTLGEPFANRSRYLKVIFDRQAPIIRVRDMGDVTTGAVSPVIEVANTTAAPLQIAVRFSVRATINAREAIESKDEPPVVLGAGKTASFSWSVKTPEKQPRYLFMRVESPDGKKVYHEGICRIARPRLPVWQEAGAVNQEPVIFETVYYPYMRKLKAVADFGGMGNAAAVAGVDFTVKDSAGRPLASARTGERENNAVEAVIAVPPDLPDGTHTVEAAIRDASGKILAVKTDTFRKKTFPFERNTIGVSDKVLRPWTPISVSRRGPSVSVWNRTYTFDKTGLPGTIVAHGRQILAAPIRLVERTESGTAPLAGAGIRFVSTGDARVEIAAKAAGRRTTADVKVLCEYDGMLKYEVSLSGKKGDRIQGLDLVVPLKEEHARFLHAAGDGCRSNYSHALPAGRGRVWDAAAVMNWTMPHAWLTYTWLGDHERGLCWWADSAEGWTLPRDKQTPAVEIVREKGIVNLVFHIVARPAHALWRNETPRKLVFAFEATPVRPRPSWARDIGTCDAGVTKQRFPRFAWCGWTGWAFVGQEKENSGANYTFAHLRPVNAAAEEALRTRCDAEEAGGRRTLVYTDMRARAMAHEEPKYFAHEWNPTRSDHRKAVVESMPRHGAVTISATQSRIDYDLWCFKLGMDLGIDYWYFDEIQNEGQINPVTGLGYRDEDGQWLPTMRLFAYRELWKRLYTLMQERGQEEPVIVMHNTSTTYAGPMAFCTTTWDFEEANSDPNYRQLTKYGIDYLITEAMGHQYGFVGSTLGPGGKFEPWLESRPEEKESVERHWMGVHMILDMNPYLIGAAGVRNGLKTLGEFGWNEPDCRWIPYWKAAERNLFTVTPATGVYAALFTRPGRTLLILLNDTVKEAAVAWRPSAGMKAGRMTDAETGAVVESAGGAYRVTIPHYNYRALIVETKGKF